MALNFLLPSSLPLDRGGELDTSCGIRKGDYTFEVGEDYNWFESKRQKEILSNQLVVAIFALIVLGISEGGEFGLRDGWRAQGSKNDRNTCKSPWNCGRRGGIRTK
jgi:hypothetical protein